MEKLVNFINTIEDIQTVFLFLSKSFPSVNEHKNINEEVIVRMKGFSGKKQKKFNKKIMIDWDDCWLLVKQFRSNDRSVAKTLGETVLKQWAEAKTLGETVLKQ